jgi:hypothetical protein
MELLVDPLYIIASTQLRFGLRAGIDTAGMLLRGAVTLGLLMATRLPPALVFSAAQLAFATAYVLGYLAFAASLGAQARGAGAVGRVLGHSRWEQGPQPHSPRRAPRRRVYRMTRAPLPAPAPRAS